MTGKVVQAQTPSPTLTLVPPPGKLDRTALISLAFEMRQIAVKNGDQAFGAIVARDGVVVGLGPSRVVTNTDPTAHAEIEAIRVACQRLKTRKLRGCILYSSSKPCRMCETAAYWAGISRMIFTAAGTDGGAPTYA